VLIWGELGVGVGVGVDIGVAGWDGIYHWARWVRTGGVDGCEFICRLTELEFSLNEMRGIPRDCK
jgi:hypothetical protein